MRLGTAVVGCGRVFERYYLPAIRGLPIFDLLAVADPLPVRQDWARAAMADVRILGDLERLLDETRPEVVLVTSPPDLHARHCLAALSRGASVLVEKPYVRSTAQWRDVETTAVEHRALVWPARSRRYRSPYRRLRSWLIDRPRGWIESIEFDLAFPIRAWDAVSGYLGKAESGGGVVEDVGSHQVDLLNWLLGEEPVAIWVEPGPADKGRSRALAYNIEYAGGLVVHCKAEHGEEYREQITVIVERGRELLIAGDQLAARVPAVLESSVRAYQTVHRRLRRLFTRLGGLPDTTLSSFRLQLEAFGEEALRHRARPEVTGKERWPVVVLQSLEAIRRAAKHPGSWHEVDLAAAGSP
jgi:predicted dehydrogenase